MSSILDYFSRKKKDRSELASKKNDICQSSQGKCENENQQRKRDEVKPSDPVAKLATFKDTLASPTMSSTTASDASTSTLAAELIRRRKVAATERVSGLLNDFDVFFLGGLSIQQEKILASQVLEAGGKAHGRHVERVHLHRKVQSTFKKTKKKLLQQQIQQIEQLQQPIQGRRKVFVRGALGDGGKKDPSSSHDREKTDGSIFYPWRRDEMGMLVMEEGQGLKDCLMTNKETNTETNQNMVVVQVEWLQRTLQYQCVQPLHEYYWPTLGAENNIIVEEQQEQSESIAAKNRDCKRKAKESLERNDDHKDDDEHDVGYATLDGNTLGQIAKHPRHYTVQRVDSEDQVTGTLGIITTNNNNNNNDDDDLDAIPPLQATKGEAAGKDKPVSSSSNTSNHSVISSTSWRTEWISPSPSPTNIGLGQETSSLLILNHSSSPLFTTQPLIDSLTPTTQTNRVLPSSMETLAVNDFASSKVAAFDLDGTLIVPKSSTKGRRFARDAWDWTWFHPSVPQRLRQLHYVEGYKIFVVSNQNGVAKKQVSMQEIQTKLFDIVQQLNVPILVFAAIQDDLMRKPRWGAWDLMKEKFNGGVSIDLTSSFYVGDAAGRPKEGNRKKDFSASDLKFAMNLGLPFRTPEEFFLGSRQKLHTDRSIAELGFSPKSLEVWSSNEERDAKENVKRIMQFLFHEDNDNDDNDNDDNDNEDNQKDERKLGESKEHVHKEQDEAKVEDDDLGIEAYPGLSKPEIIVFVGSPASGKSTFFETYFQSDPFDVGPPALLQEGYSSALKQKLTTTKMTTKKKMTKKKKKKLLSYERINQDTLGNLPRCFQAARIALENGKSIVVDNTNRSRMVRKQWIDLAKQRSLSIRCIYFDIPKEVCLHLNTFRALQGIEGKLLSQTRSFSQRPRETQPQSPPDISIHSFFKNLEVPTKEEGFTQMLHITKFVMLPNLSALSKRLLTCYLR